MRRLSINARTPRPTRSRLGRLLALVLAVGGMAALAAPARAAGPVRVVLEFDNNSISQYTLGYQQALLPHHASAMFYVNSGTVGAGSSQMSWAQLTSLANANNDIGGKTVNATNLTTDPNPTAQVCNDRAAIVAHGLTPVGFAYPGGANNATVQAVVKGCGYGNARTASSGVETLPPTNWFATKAYAPSPVTLATMQAAVNAGAVNGGLVQLVIGRVCSQSLDSTNYTSCSGASGHVELGDLNAFLDWMANAGQAGGAPANAGLSRLSAVVASVDSSAPTTTITCNGATCTSTPYSGVVSVTLAATDTGSGMASTHYTTDGSDPTLASPTYSGPFNVNGSNSSTTVKFRSWDLQGNVEPTQTQVIQAPTDSVAPSTSITCNGATCASPYVATVSIALSATDSGGSGVASTYYTTDGSTPTTSSTSYTGPFTLNSPGTYTIKYFSTDKAGNAEQVQSQSVTVTPVKTKVSLTFDNGTVGQYTLGWLQALKPHNDTATFYVNSGTVGVSANTMTWNQLGDLFAAGNDIGGKTVSSSNLTTDPNPTAQVCDDRTALANHGLDPIGFAYPGGANNQTVRDIVKNCGYGVARSAGSLSPTGPTYAEKLPPNAWYATRAYAPSGQMTLANMEALVNGAASNGGGWSQIVITRVCSQAQDPNNYTSCTGAAGWVELSDLNAFLDWMAQAGQSGGAPAGAQLATVKDAAVGADTVAPVTTATCNGTACSTSTYTSTVYVALSSTDVGSAVTSTHYTTDGSTPTLSSPTYSTAIPVTSTTTVKYRSWDHAGNAEATNSLLVTTNLSPDSTPPTTVIACDGQPCTTDGYNGSTKVTLTADDGSGWGVAATYYTLDGTTPSTSSTMYSGPITLNTAGTYTVEWFSTDLAGNAEQVQAQTIIVLPPKVVVSFTFDDGDASQYSLAFQRALQPHGMHGTFYINTGNLAAGPGFMTWPQVEGMAQAGDDVGGHTLDHIDLTSSTYTQQQKVDEVCNDRLALIAHGVDATSFAYPFGAFDANAESIVQSCGYTDARRTGGIPTSGAPYAETIPPKDPYATITWTAPTPTSSPVQLSDMQNAVTTAAAHGGGWVQFVGHEICSQTYDPSNYTSCMGSFRPLELSTLSAFMDWLQNSGQPGGAPARTQVKTVNDVINGPDTAAPTTTLVCNGSGCAPSYTGSVTVDFKASDLGGSGIAGTYYTTDGSTPTTSSTKAGRAFTINSDTTFKFFSVDNAGNAEPVQTLTVQSTPRTDPVVGTAGDIACDPSVVAFNDGQGTSTDCRAAHTAQLLEGVDAVLPLGDNQYNCGGAAAWAASYDPTWGVLKSISHPVPGDADYATSGGTDCPATPGAGYYQYFGAAAGDPSKGYYSYDLGQWHVVAINTAPCEKDASTCAAGSAQEQWLRQDLASDTSPCTLAYYQNPRFTSTSGGGNSFMQPIWQDLYDGGVDVVLNGDSHWYERFAQVNGSGQPDAAFGTREFIVGTGGQGLDAPTNPLSFSEVANSSTHGVLKLTLHSGSYDWGFVPDEGTFTDSGTAGCHGKPTPADTTPPTTTIACGGAPCTGWYAGSTQVSLAATDNTGGSGVANTYYTTDGSTPTTSSTAYTAPFTVTTTSTVRFFSTDAKGNAETPKSQLVQVDGTPPTTSAACNGSTCSTGWYAGSVSMTLSGVDSGGSGVAATYYTTDGSTPTTSSTPYTGAFNVTSTRTVKFFSVDTAGNPEAVKSQLVQIDSAAPTTTIACNGSTCSTGTYLAAVSVTVSATDASGGSGVAGTYYTTDGSAPTTSSTPYTGAFSVSSTRTVRYFSVDNAGNSEPAKSQQIAVDTTAPTTAIGCNGSTCTNFYGAAVSVSLSASDGTGGSGVAATYYTTNGNTPTTSSTRYTGPFSLASTATVKYFSVDNAGNQEAVKSQLVSIDTTPPVTTISCNATTCGPWYDASVTVRLSATDNGGSGVAATYYTTNGSTPTTASTRYTGSFSVGSTRTVKFFSVDQLGRAEPVQSQLISIDTTAPSTTIRCNGTTCSKSTYTSAVSVSFVATDTGSGVSSTHYTTDGSTPTLTSPTYTGAFTVSTSTTVKFRSWDVAGNVEGTNSQKISVSIRAAATAFGSQLG